VFTTLEIIGIITNVMLIVFCNDLHSNRLKMITNNMEMIFLQFWAILIIGVHVMYIFNWYITYKGLYMAIVYNYVKDLLKLSIITEWELSYIQYIIINCKSNLMYTIWIGCCMCIYIYRGDINHTCSYG
jgi:hypothetical protein